MPIDSWEWWVCQGCAFIALIFVIISFQQKTTKRVLIFRNIATLFNLAGVAFLGNLSIIFLNIVGALRNASALYFAVKPKTHRAIKWATCAALAALLAALNGIFWENYLNILSITMGLLLIVSFMQPTAKRIRAVGFFAQIVGIVYTSLLVIPINIAIEAFGFCSVIVGMVRLDFPRKKAKTEPEPEKWVTPESIALKPDFDLISDSYQRNFIFIHGRNGGSDVSWGSWLKRQLQEQYEVLMPQFPTGDDASLPGWEKELLKIAHKITPETVFVCHSIGCPTMVNFLARNNISVRACIFVAGPGTDEIVKKGNEDRWEKMSNWERPFLPTDAVYQKFIALCPIRYCLYSDNDHLLPQNSLETFAEKIEAKEKIFIPGKGHFGKKADIKEIPEIMEILKKEKLV